MMSPLEYLFFAMMSTQSPDAAAINKIHAIEPATGNRETHRVITGESGFFELRTILVQPHNELAQKLEAPMRITQEWIPAFEIGAPLTIKIDETGKSYPAHIVRIVKITDESGVTIQVIAGLDQLLDELKPGMTALATMPAPVTTTQ